MPVLIAFALSACDAPSDKDEGVAPVEGGDLDTEDTPGSDDSAPPPEEVCNGIDDDGDGDIDEGFGDFDADGVADCVDGTCVGATAAAEAVSVICEGEPLSTWEMELKWGLQSDGAKLSEWWGATTSPIVIDTDGDGFAEVLLGAFAGRPAQVVIVDGGSGEIRTEVNFPLRSDEYGLTPLGLAAGDVDFDGVPDLFALYEAPPDLGRPFLLSRFDAEGEQAWAVQLAEPATVTLADLESDGIIEAITTVDIRDAATGAWRADLEREPEDCCHPVVADLDLDGISEIIVGQAVFDSEGQLRWRAPDPPTLFCSGGVPVQADDDLAAEVLVTNDRGFRVFQDDGTLYSRGPELVGARYVETPCVADFDGDGVSEVSFGFAGKQVMMELDGTVVWQNPPDSALASIEVNFCTAWDMDGDGAAEVIRAASDLVTILDGRTGRRLGALINENYYTGYVSMAIADVDGDGSAEILIPSSPDPTRAHNFLLAIGAPGGRGWPSAGPNWPIEDYNTRNMTASGEWVDPGAFWEDPGLYRAQITGKLPYSSDLAVAFVDVCASACPPEGVSEATIQVTNAGAESTRAGLTLSLYAGDTLVETRLLPVVPAATAMESVTFAFPTTTAPLHAVVDEADAWVECDEENNEATWNVPLDCP